MSHTINMRHLFFVVFATLFFLSLTCCSILKSSGDNDISTDASPRERDLLDLAALCGDRIDIDCFVCDEFCANRVASGCYQNRCSCGIGSECNESSDCRFERCIEADPEGPSCEFDSECSPGFLCIRARCSPAGCIPEVCNGYDDDCDGNVDGTSNGPLARWCSGNDAPLTSSITLLPPCRQGSQICSGGRWQACTGGVYPVPENGLLACDLIDNDCDGCTDGRIVDGVCSQSTSNKFDVVFAIDVSGSMEGTIAAVRESASMFASSVSSLSDIKFGIVIFPGPYDRDWTVLQTLVEFTYFNSTLSGVHIVPRGGEASYDVVQGLLDQSIVVGWNPDTTRIIIMFTDEQPQTYIMPPSTEASMCAANTRGEVVAVVTDLVYHRQYDQCSMTFNLTSNAIEMTENLRTIIQNPCN